MSEPIKLKGCGNHGCVLVKPSGMATNGPCTCLNGLYSEKRLRVRLVLRALRKELREYGWEEGELYE